MIKELVSKGKLPKGLSVACIAIFVLITIIGLVNVIDISSNVSQVLDNFAIDNLSLEDIIYKEFSSTFASSRKYESGTKTGVDGASKYEDSDRIEFRCKKMTGIKRVSVTKVSDCTLTISISSKLSSGNARIVVICDDEILEYVEFGQKKTLTYDVTGEHIYFVKILAEEAELEIAVEREIN